MSNFSNQDLGDPVESEIINVMRKKDYSLDTVNNYGDNLLHMSAANGCYGVIKEILKKHDSREIDQQNDCGWTPLMQAIRNGNVQTVKLLLENGCKVEQSAFQGISAIALSVAIGREMFELVNEACPSALGKSKNDYVNPLCIAAMKNDKGLFFRLLELGLKVSEAGDYTLLMMAKSNVPEIAQLGELHNEDENYWMENDSLDDLESLSDEEFHVPQMSSTLQDAENSLQHHHDRRIDDLDIPSISVIHSDGLPKSSGSKGSAPMSMNSGEKITSKSLVSPRLDYTRDETLPKSPNFCFVRRENISDSGFGKEIKTNWDKIEENGLDDPSKKNVSNDETKKYKYRTKRPPDLQIPKNDEKPEGSSGDTPLSSNKTPIEPRYRTPPKEVSLDIHQKKMAFLLKFFGLTHFVPIFLEQEVDLHLFLSLTDEDLREIGIEKKSDRIILLSVIEECNRNKSMI